MTQPAPDLSLPQRRVIVIGASNVALGIASLIPACHQRWGSPLDLFLAGGHGRALKFPSYVLGRSLPSILESSLWETLSKQPQLPTAVLVTDVGNDLVYGANPQDVVDAAAELLERLQPWADRLVVTGLPVASVERISPKWYARFRRCLFPSSTLSYEEAVSGAYAVQQQLSRLTGRFGYYFVSPDPRWYGWDPVHVKRKHYRAAWNRYLMPWNDFQAPMRTPRHRRFDTWRWWRRLRPAARTWRGKDWSAKQPCYVDPRGSRYWVY